MVFALMMALAGAALSLAAAMTQRRIEACELEELLGLPAAGAAEKKAALDDTSPLADRAVGLAGGLVMRVDRRRSLGATLDRAQVPLGPGELVVVVSAAALGVGALALLATGSRPLAAAAATVPALLVKPYLRRRVNKRRKAFEAALPDALSLVASSLSAGHTFLRAIQMMCEESAPPLSEEFARVVTETRLGDPVVDAVERMADRLQVRDLDMVVQAIRIQQTVGGRLADLLHTLAEVIRARGEVRREVMVLTAEGRLSAYVLAALVPLLFLVLRVTNPAYVEPLYAGLGLVLLMGCAVSVVAGLVVILRMVRIDI